ncbi:MAG: response regulator [Sideroxydans sp.]|nr:response regulator [Sideroxydans sp.]
MGVSIIKRILIVDDYSSIRSLIKVVIHQLGNSEVVEASDGLAALAKLKQQSFDLVVTDWNMPNMSGIELLAAIRADEVLKAIPVILLTAETTKENISEAVKLGVNGYVAKPFTPEKLQSTLSEWI